MPRQPLSSIEVAWLRLEEPASPMSITVALLFDTPLDFERLRATFEQRLLPFARFRQRVVPPANAWGTYYWDDDSDFDLDDHLLQRTVAPPGDEAALRETVSELVSTPLDLSRPLWQFHLVEDCGSGCALVGRVHHCLADGPALMRVLLALADNQSAVEPEDTFPPSPSAVRATARLVDMLLETGASLLTNPFHLFRLARLGGDALAVMRKLAFRSPDPKTALRGKLGRAKRVAWSAPIPLADVKAAGAPVGGTVNDVMLAAVAGALRRYLQGRGEPVDGLSLRAGLSVNLRAPDEPPRLDNRAGAVLVALPVGVGDPAARLRLVKQRMDALKNSPEANLVHGLLAALGQATPDVQDSLVASYCTRDTAVIANVPGPREPLSVAGAALGGLMFWVPAFGRVGLGLSVVSYAGQVRLGVVTDRGLVPDPEPLVAAFHAAFEELLALAGPGATSTPIEQAHAQLDRVLADLEAL